MAIMYNNRSVVIPKRYCLSGGLRPGIRLKFGTEKNRVYVEAEASAYERWKTGHRKIRRRADLAGKSGENYLAKVEKRMKEKMLHVP